MKEEQTCMWSAYTGSLIETKTIQNAEQRLSKLTTALHQAQRQKHKWLEKKKPIDKSDIQSRETHPSKIKLYIWKLHIYKDSTVSCFKLFITPLQILVAVHILNAENEDFSNIVTMLLRWYYVLLCALLLEVLASNIYLSSLHPIVHISELSALTRKFEAFHTISTIPIKICHYTKQQISKQQNFRAFNHILELISINEKICPIFLKLNNVGGCYVFRNKLSILNTV